MEMAVVYFRVYALGLIFQFGYNIVATVLRGVGDSQATMYFLLIAAVINVGLDIVFVAVLHLGAMGGGACNRYIAGRVLCRSSNLYDCKIPNFSLEIQRVDL